nr:MAG TPA: hypothetical protein [Caudoviricetes sp.]
MPADAPQRPADAPPRATLPAGPLRPSERRFRSLRGRPRRPGVCAAAPETAPSNYATSVLRKSRNSKCELRLTFVKSGLRS